MLPLGIVSSYLLLLLTVVLRWLVVFAFRAGSAMLFSASPLTLSVIVDMQAERRIQMVSKLLCLSLWRLATCFFFSIILVILYLVGVNYLVRILRMNLLGFTTKILDIDNDDDDGD